MATEITIPKLGLTMTEAAITKWLKLEGDQVAQGEPVVEIMTEKVSYEVEAPSSGSLKIVAVEEATIPVAGIIGYIVQAGEEIPTTAAHSEGTVEGPQALPEQATPQLSLDRSEKRISPAAKRLASEMGIDMGELEIVPGTGPQGRVTQEDVKLYVERKQRSGEQDEARARTLASALARKIAEDENVNLTEVQGTGVHDKVLKQDVLKVVESGQALAKRIEPLTGLRKVIAKRMTLSATTIPQFTLAAQANVDKLIALRQDLKPAMEKSYGLKLTVTDLIILLVAKALRSFPKINASYTEEGIAYNDSVNIGLATAAAEGLIVPVIHNAEQKTLAEICQASKDLARKAREGGLTLNDVSGGTFTVSNLGMFGIEIFRAIINPPEAAILAIGKTTESLGLANGEIKAKQMLWLSLTADHRVLDGAEAAQFLNRVKELLEDPELVLV